MPHSARPILLTGGTGFVGNLLGTELVRRGYKLRVLARDPSKVAGSLAYPAEIYRWDQATLDFPSDALEACAAVINLAGEPIAEGRWTSTKKSRIRASRVHTTSALIHRLLHHPAKPQVFIQASATGYYGDRGGEVLTEEAGPGQGFLSSVCREWEAAAQPIADSGVRTVTLRTGMVLGLSGGALPELASLYVKGLGGVIGNGKQWVSWIHVNDLVALIIAALEDERYTGAINATAPTPCQYRELHDSLNRSLGTRGNLPVPRLIMKAALGEKSCIILDSTRTSCDKVLNLGFPFKHRLIADTLQSLYEDSVEPRAQRLIVQQWIPADLEKTWDFFSSERNLERITPPFLKFLVTAMSTDRISEGTYIDYKLRIHGLPIIWKSLISKWRPPHEFIDLQTKGPYALWHHRHTFEPLADGVLISDVIQYRLPVPPLGSIIAGPIVDKDIREIFAYRKRIIAEAFQIS